MSLRRRTKKTEKRQEKTRITYFLETNKKVIDTTVIGYVDASPQESVESTRSYVLSLMQGPSSGTTKSSFGGGLRTKPAMSSRLMTTSHRRRSRP